MSAPLLEEIVEAGIQSALGTVETAQPGLVTAFNKEAHTVDVQPVFKRTYEREDGQIAEITQPVIPSVPIWYLGSGDARMTFPIEKGSTVLLVHLSGDRMAWQFSKGTAPVTPSDPRRHALTDCVAIPGGLTASVAKRLATAGSSRVADDGIVFHTPGKIYLGGGLVTSPIALKSDLNTINAAIAAALVTANAAVLVPATAVVGAAAVYTLGILQSALSTLNFPVCSSVTESE